ncbi:B12-binding domain-containing radical SAM protein [Paenibacillus albidus]|uniref:B12-binding domain-containing radical SAM protein n=1 Tax=Paenibacillus albidus TaxID=2041023 RepID=A0A917D1H6_9BACL|nr:radical SAM protein [Paenibacillus albidus]GGG07193.1 B12-binding domain-containing radical SAM protein [Paenibacillus albidus]
MSGEPLIILVTPAPLSNRTSEENLGLGYIASYSRNKGIKVIIIDGWLQNLTPSEIGDQIMEQDKPLFIGFSCYQLNKGKAIETIEYLRSKQYDVPFIAGGFGPTFHAEAFLRSGFDIAMHVEGEIPTYELARHFLTGTPRLNEISGISYLNEDGKFVSNRGCLVHDLDSLPFPARDTMHIPIQERTPVDLLTSRGCTGHCSFCSVISFWRQAEGNNWRSRSLENVVDEIEDLYHKGARYFKFVDDSFIEGSRDGEWCKRFADEILRRKLDIRMRISIRADKINEAIITELMRARCNSIACGIESFSNSALKRMGKKADVKQNMESLDILKKKNLYVQTGYILFDYGTTMEELRENFQYMRKYHWTVCKGIFTEMYAAIGTPYTRSILKMGIVKGDKPILDNYQYYIINEQVQIVYNALKTWHASHMKVYDMAIDPISKPKALDDLEMSRFYDIYLEIRNKDLDMFENILCWVEDGESEQEVYERTNNQIQALAPWYNNIELKVMELYELEKIAYKGIDNPFVNLQ